MTTDSATAAPAAGLTAPEVDARVARGLVNAPAGHVGRSTWDVIRANTFTRFNGLLGALLVVMLVVGPLQDALFGLVIVSNTLVGIVQELRAKRTLDRLAVVSEGRPRVRRDGSETRIGVHDVVVDDICVLSSGDQIVVDGEVVEAGSLEVDESLLTGESDPVVKAVGDSVLSGSFVVAGNGAFRATRVGADAYAAELASEARQFSLARSELRSGIDRIIATMAKVMVPVGVALLISELFTASSVRGAIRGTVAGLVTMVPEGLVLLTSVAFAVGVVRLGRRGVLVQELPAIEGLARVDVVCLDKTGTLTEPVMRLVLVEPLGEMGEDAVREALGALGAADPRPNASLQAVIDACPAPQGWTPTSTIPFSSARGWSGASFDGRGTWLLGGPDVLAPQDRSAQRRAEELAGQGMRVLAVARVDGEAGPTDSDGAPPGARPVALIAVEQPLRPDAAETLAYLADQGVQVDVVSGDHAATVGAVAGRLGVAGADEPVDARRLPHDGEEFARVVARGRVFGRVVPPQKRELVRALQADGHVVAMTGDGVNDVLALKAADVGIAMGNGSDATRAVAQLVLLDSRFAVVPRIVDEGRRVIANIERVAQLFLTKTVYATVFAVLVVVARVPFPFLPRHLTLVGTLTIGTPAFVLALLPNSQRTSPGFLRRVLRLAMPAGVIAASASFAAYGLALLDDGLTVDERRTIATLVLAAVALWVLVIVARPLTVVTGSLVAAMALAFGVVLATPWLRHFFALDPPPPSHWGPAGACVVAGVMALEVTRWVLRRSRSDER